MGYLYLLLMLLYDSLSLVSGVKHWTASEVIAQKKWKKWTWEYCTAPVGLRWTHNDALVHCLVERQHRHQQCILDLYCDEEGKGIEQEYWEQEPPPLRSEVARAIHQTASRKATGSDEVPAELFKAGGETVLDRMHRICVAITSQERQS